MLIKRVALDHSMKTCWITIKPDDQASIRTCEIIHARFVEAFEIPDDQEEYIDGEKEMYRFKWDIQ